MAKFPIFIYYLLVQVTLSLIVCSCSQFQTDFLKLMMNSQVEDIELELQGQSKTVLGPDGLWSMQGKDAWRQ